MKYMPEIKEVWEIDFFYLSFSSTASSVPVKSRAMLVRADGIASFLEKFISAATSVIPEHFG